MLLSKRSALKCAASRSKTCSNRLAGWSATEVTQVITVALVRGHPTPADPHLDTVSSRREPGYFPGVDGRFLWLLDVYAAVPLVTLGVLAGMTAESGSLLREPTDVTRASGEGNLDVRTCPTSPRDIHSNCQVFRRHPLGKEWVLQLAKSAHCGRLLNRLPAPWARATALVLLRPGNHRFDRPNEGIRRVVISLVVLWCG